MTSAKKAKDQKRRRPPWPRSSSFGGCIDLHVLPSVPSINGARIRALTGNDQIPDSTTVILRAFRSVVGSRVFHIGFCLGDGERFSAIGIAVIDRLAMEAPAAPLHVVPIAHADVAWDIVQRHIRSFTGSVLLFAFADSDVYDAGTAAMAYSTQVRQFGPDGVQLRRLTASERKQILARKAAILDRPPPPAFYPATEVEQEDVPWIFRFATPSGKVLRTAVWNGRRDYEHIPPAEIANWVGGDKIAIVQVASPVGVDRRSSLLLTHHLANDFDGVIHWARDTETFLSIINSFVRLDLESVGPLEVSEDWSPEITIMAAND